MCTPHYHGRCHRPIAWLDPLGLSNSSDTRTTLYTGPYRSSAAFLSPNSSVFLAIARYSSEEEKNLQGLRRVEIFSNFTSNLSQT